MLIIVNDPKSAYFICQFSHWSDQLTNAKVMISIPGKLVENEQHGNSELCVTCCCTGGLVKRLMQTRNDLEESSTAIRGRTEIVRCWLYLSPVQTCRH